MTDTVPTQTPRTRTAERRLVTVTGPLGSRDLRVPGDAPVDLFLPPLLPDLVGDEALHESRQAWQLATVTGGVLAGPQCLDDLGLGDGSVLYLETELGFGATVDRTAEVTAPRSGMAVWDRGSRQRLLTAWSSAVLVVIAAALVATAPPARPAAAAALPAGLAAMAAVALLLRRRLSTDAWLAAGPVALLAVGGWDTGAGGGLVVAALAAAGAVGAGAAILAAGGPDGRSVAAGMTMAAGPAAIALGGTRAAHGGLGAAAACAGALWCLSLQVLPRLAVFASGADRPPEDAHPVESGNLLDRPHEVSEAHLRRARRLLTALLAGAAVGLALTGGVLLAVGTPSALALLTAMAFFTGLRSRRHRRRVEVGLVYGACLTLATATGASVAGQLSPDPSRTFEMVLVAVVVAGLAGLAAQLPGPGPLGVSARRSLRNVEVVLRLSLLPLALWAAGVFGGVSAGSTHLTHLL